MNAVKPKMNTMKKGGAAKKAKPMMKKGGVMNTSKKNLPKAQKAGEVNKFKPSTLDKVNYALMNAADSGINSRLQFEKGQLGNVFRSRDSLNVQDAAYGRKTEAAKQWNKAIKDAKAKNPQGNFNSSLIKPQIEKKKGGAAKAKPMMKKGGSMPMVKKDGKMVPAFAADGKGKMMYGGAKKSMMKKGGAARKK